VQVQLEVQDVLRLKTIRYTVTCVHFTRSCDVSNVLREDSSAGCLLVEFHKHATELHVFDRSSRHPYTPADFVDVACAAFSEPPSSVPAAAAISPSVVVAVRSTELPPVRDLDRRLRNHHGIAGVSAVPGHRQLVLTDLITDGERRVVQVLQVNVLFNVQIY